MKNTIKLLAAVALMSLSLSAVASEMEESLQSNSVEELQSIETTVSHTVSCNCQVEAIAGRYCTCPHAQMTGNKIDSLGSFVTRTYNTVCEATFSDPKLYARPANLNYSCLGSSCTRVSSGTGHTFTNWTFTSKTLIFNSFDCVVAVKPNAAP